MMDIPELDKSGLRNFALTTGGLIALLFGFVLPWIFGLTLQVWALAVGSVLAVWGLVWPSSLRMVYKLWMRLALFLNKVTSPLIMGLIFYLLLLPMGLAMRWLARRDPMKRTFQREVSSYRVEHNDQESDLRNPF